jgi:hypothetical protein
VTGSVELGAPPGDMTVGPLAVGAGAVWVGNGGGRVTARVDPMRLRVTARFGGHVAVVSREVLWSYCRPRGGRGRGARPRRRPPLLLKDAAGRCQPV